MDKKQLIERIEKLEEAVKVRIPELEKELTHVREDRDAEYERAENLMRYKTEMEMTASQLRTLLDFDALAANTPGMPQEQTLREKIQEEIKKYVPAGSTTKIDGLSVPKYIAEVEAEKIKFMFEKHDPKSMVLYAISKTSGRKGMGDIKSTMIMMGAGYKKAADDIAGYLAELENEGFIVVAKKGAGGGDRNQYNLTPGITWIFPEDKEHND